LQYGVRTGLDILRPYADNGTSGLRIDGPDALKQFLIDRKWFCRISRFST
jgi:hypothetical protein